MDAMIENVRSSFEVSVRKMLPKKQPLIQPDKKLSNTSKVFGVSIVDLCAYENNTVPYLVKDICSFIKENYLSSEGIFRLSAPSSQILKLREAFEKSYGFCDDNISVAALAEIDGNTAANVLKQFLRQLPTPLIDSNILKIAKDSTCLSDETFAMNTMLSMESWPVAKKCTLQYLLSFLQLVMRNAKNRMTVTGLAVVFGPNVFEISSGLEGLEQQALANKTFERLLLTSDIICKRLPDDQGYLKMASPTSPPSKPVRLAPPVPKQARPLPPPPVPRHGEGDGVTPGLPHRLESLDHDVLDLLDSQSEDLSDDVIIVGPDKLMIEKTISHVVHRHLFNDSAASSPRLTEYSDESSDVDDSCALLPLASIPDVKENIAIETVKKIESIPVEEPTPKLPDLTPPDTSETPTNPDTIFPQPAAVTTPDSGCLTAEDDLKNHPVIVPKLDLQGAIEDGESVVMETVPPLDLSDVVQADAVAQPKPLPRKLKTTPTKTKKKRRKNNELSPKNVVYQQLKSEPISIPEGIRHESSDNDSSDVIVDFSPKEEGSTRWRDAWSTDDDEVYPQFIDKLSKYQGEKENGDVELAPSSPIQHQFPRTHHHHHHHKHHHHHNNHSSAISRPKVTQGFKEPDNLNDIEISLEKIMIALASNRKTNGRPEDLTLMTRDQIRAEKLSMQRELLNYEGMHGRPSTKGQKEIMRNVYDRYRMVKRLLVDVMSPPFHSTLSRRYDDADFEYDVNNEEGEEAFGVTQLLTLNPSHHNNGAVVANTNSDHVSGDLGITELRKQQRQVKGQCKRMRRKIKEFEKEFKEQNNRSVTQGDRVVMATEYSEYKEMKAKLRLLDALIEKHNAPFRSP